MKPYYESEYGKLYLGDCLEIMPSLQEKVELVLTDPPYGTTQCKWDSVIPFDKMWGDIDSCLANSGCVVLFGQGTATARVVLSNEQKFKYKIVWVKSKATNFLNAKKQPLRKHEDICVFYDSKPVYSPQMTEGEPYNKGVRKDQQTGAYGEFRPAYIKSEGSRYPTDVIYFKTAESEGTVFHPTQKPVALMGYLIRTYTNFGDTVLDFTIGSGTTAVAAINTGRKFIGIEKEEKYCEIAKQRITEAEEKMKEFEI